MTVEISKKATMVSIEVIRAKAPLIVDASPKRHELCAAEELQPVDRMTPREIIRSIPAQDFICGAAASFGFVLFFAAVSVVVS